MLRQTANADVALSVTRLILPIALLHRVCPLRTALEQQWEANRSETGGHEWDSPEWAEIAVDGCPLPPFKWSDDRRAVLRAELDAYYARLYGLTCKQLRYILDPHGLSEKELADILDPWKDPTCSGPPSTSPVRRSGC